MELDIGLALDPTRNVGRQPHLSKVPCRESKALTINRTADITVSGMDLPGELGPCSTSEIQNDGAGTPSTIGLASMLATGQEPLGGFGLNIAMANEWMDGTGTPSTRPAEPQDQQLWDPNRNRSYTQRWLAGYRANFSWSN